MKFTLPQKKVNYLISIEFIQLFNLLRINFSSQPLYLFNIVNLTYSMFIYHYPLFNTLEPTLNKVSIQQIKMLKRNSKTLVLENRHNKLNRMYRTNPFTVGQQKAKYNLHNHFNKFKESFTNPPFNLFNPLVRLRRRRYGTLSERTPFLKKLRMNRTKKKSKYRKHKAPTFW